MDNRDEAAQRAAKQHYILHGQPAASWSATRPAYSGTCLEAGKGIKREGDGKNEKFICHL